MYSTSLFVPLAAMLGLRLVQAHGVILGAQGIAGSPLSVGFQVNNAIARNCTTISPCQLDATIIRDTEIKANIVNHCGRTQLAGNIDIAENTEDALAAKAVTQVKAGGDVVVTIHQVNADGAGPYVCDIDETSNSGLVSQTLKVTNNVPGVNGLSQAKAQDFNITVTMPTDMKCTGASTGNICTIRCRNNSVAGPFGGCFAVQQVGIEPTTNTPESIATFKTLEEVFDEIAVNQKDLPAAIKANQNAGSSEAEQNAAAVAAILGTPTTVGSPTLTPDAALGGPISTTAAAPATTTTAATRGNGRNRNNNNGNGNANRNGNNNANSQRNQQREIGPNRHYDVTDGHY